METYIIAGLGNFDKSYENTRHNSGFKALDRLANRLNVDIKEKKFNSLCAQTYYNGRKLFLMKPLTWMNLSGMAVKPASQYFNIPVHHIIIVFDDVYLDCGRIRIRPKGSSGGHNGVKNIIELLGSEDFPRVRIGVGKIKDEDLKDFVLARFDSEKGKLMDKVFDVVSKALLYVIDEGVYSAMNQYNGLNISI